MSENLDVGSRAHWQARAIKAEAELEEARRIVDTFMQELRKLSNKPPSEQASDLAECLRQYDFAALLTIAEGRGRR